MGIARRTAGWRRIPRGVLLALVVALAAAAGGCAREAEPRGRVLLVGIDGAAPSVLRELLEEGRLPHLAQVARDGAVVELRSLHPLLSPRIWNSVATGKRPEAHGIEGWVRLDASGDPRLYTSEDRRSHALWNIASAAGLRVGVVNWLNTHPPERVDGIMISDHALPGAEKGKLEVAGLFAERRHPDAQDVQEPEGRAAVSHPESFARIVEALVRAPDRIEDAATLVRAAQPLGGRYPDVMELAWEADELVARLALRVEEELRPDLLMVLLQGIDRVSHFLWFGQEPPEAYPPELRRDDRERAAAAEALAAYYAATDALLGRLLEGFGSEDLVMIVSDHGFEAGSPAPGLTGAHETGAAQDGVLLARGPGIAPGIREADVGVLDVTPTILAWLGIPAGRDMEGRAADLLDVRAPRRIATHDTQPIERVRGAGSGMEQSIVEQLRELGYVE